MQEGIADPLLRARFGLVGLEPFCRNPLAFGQVAWKLQFSGQ